jgi:hypothetical protein
MHLISSHKLTGSIKADIRPTDTAFVSIESGFIKNVAFYDLGADYYLSVNIADGKQGTHLVNTCEGKIKTFINADFQHSKGERVIILLAKS